MALLDVEKATEEFRQRLESGYFDESDKQLLDAMDEYPEGLKDEDTPHWEDSSNGWMCSKCKQDSTLDTEYCPHCHAKMANGVKDKKDEFPLSQEEINNLLKALQNDDLTQKLHDMLSNNPYDVCYKAGYEQGYQEAKTEFYENRYQEGLQDAWEMTLKVIDMSLSQRKAILGDYSFYDSIQKNTASEALEKIKAYEQRIEVGDEVYFVDSNHKRVVTAIIDGAAVQFTETGKWAVDDVDKLHKTGKHYDIQSILDGLGEE